MNDSNEYILNKIVMQVQSRVFYSISLIYSKIRRNLRYIIVIFTNSSYKSSNKIAILYTS